MKALANEAPQEHRSQRTLRATCEDELQRANAALERLRHQPLDPYVLERVAHAEREAERWTRAAEALERNTSPVGLREHPGPLVSRVLAQVREAWGCSGLQIEKTIPNLAPRCFDRRAYAEAIHSVVDMLLANASEPESLVVALSERKDALVVELNVEAKTIRNGCAAVPSWLVGRSGGDLTVELGETWVRAVLRFIHADEQQARQFLFPFMESR